MRRTLVVLAAGIFVLAGHAFTAPAESVAQRTERLTEELAHVLIEFAGQVRTGGPADVSGHFAPAVRWRKPPEEAKTETVRGLEKTRWVIGGEPMVATPAEILESLRFVYGAHRGESLSLAPVSSKLVGEVLVARVKIAIVGAPDERGQRIASNGAYEVTVENGRINGFVLLSATSIKSTHAWFTEATPEEMRATDPAVLDHPTLGLAAYGAAAADVDGNGRIDIVSTGHDKTRLYLNKGGLRFEASEIKTPRQATAPLLLDFDNDGDPDLFLSANGRQMLLENRAGRFVDVSEKAGVDKATIGFSVAAGDINGDGVPDIYVTAYNNYGPVAPASWDAAQNGLPNLLFVSNGDGTYTEAAKKWGVAGNGWSYAAQFSDLDGDGRLDLYVANDFGGGNPLYLHRGDHFEDHAKAWGVRDNGYGMGVSFGDFDNDGDFDLHVTKMSSKAGNRILERLHGLDALKPLAAGNALYEQVAPGKFKEVSKTAGPFPAGWAWGGGFLDIDNDGLLDLHTPNGFLSGRSEKDT